LTANGGPLPLSVEAPASLDWMPVPAGVKCPFEAAGGYAGMLGENEL